MIANLAVWFGLHVLFRDVRVVSAYGATLDVPVLASVDVASAVLFAGAAWALLRAGYGTITAPVWGSQL